MSTATSPTRLSGHVSLLLGLVTLSIATGFAYVNHDFTWPKGSFATSTLILVGHAVMGLLFQFATPVLCAATFFFGVPARRFSSARWGMAAAALSLGLYANFVAVCYRTLARL